MHKDNKENIVYFEGPSMKELFSNMETWQKRHRKRLLSIEIEKEGNNFCCVALTNPSEVVLVAKADANAAAIALDGQYVEIGRPTRSNKLLTD